MTENNVTTGIRRRVVDKTIENVNAKQGALSMEFLEELRALLTAATVPKADAYLHLFERQVGDHS